MKFHIKRGDEVVIINGAQAGKRGKILEILRNKESAIVEGVNIVKKHVRKSEDSPQGGIVEREAPLRLCKLMLAEKYDARKAKRGETA